MGDIGQIANRRGNNIKYGWLDFQSIEFSRGLELLKIKYKSFLWQINPHKTDFHNLCLAS